MKLITVCTTENYFSNDWKIMAELNGYDYELIGLGMKWTGFKLLMELIRDKLRDIPTNVVVAIVDCYDLIMVRKSKELESYYRSHHPGKIVVGTEKTCKENCHNQQICPPIDVYPNTGFLIGLAGNMLELYDYMSDFTDDQIALNNYREHVNCSRIYLDVNSEYVLNLNPPKYKGSIKLNELSLPGSRTLVYNGHRPFAVHIPFMYRDRGKRSNRVRTELIPNYQSPLTKLQWEHAYWRHFFKNAVTNPVFYPYWGLFAVVLILIIAIPIGVHMAKKKAMTI